MAHRVGVARVGHAVPRLGGRSNGLVAVRGKRRTAIRETMRLPKSTRILILAAGSRRQAFVAGQAVLHKGPRGVADLRRVGHGPRGQLARHVVVGDVRHAHESGLCRFPTARRWFVFPRTNDQHVVRDARHHVPIPGR